MLARVANNLYWLGRYLHRVEITARLIRSHAKLLMDLPGADEKRSWLSLVAAIGGEDIFRHSANDTIEDSMFRFLVSDTDNPSSMINNLQAISTNLRSCRDCLSIELYSLIRNLCDFDHALVKTGADVRARLLLLSDIENQSFAIKGATSGTLSCDAGYLSLRAGGYLERVDMTTRILDVRMATLLSADKSSEQEMFDTIQWGSVLRTFSALQSYIKYVRKPIAGAYILPFLLQDEHFSNSVQWCLIELARSVESIGPGHQQAVEGAAQTNSDFSSHSIVALDALIKKIKQVDVVSLVENKNTLHEHLRLIQDELITINNEIALRYFLPTEYEGE